MQKDKALKTEGSKELYLRVEHSTIKVLIVLLHIIFKEIGTNKISKSRTYFEMGGGYIFKKKMCQVLNYI